MGHPFNLRGRENDRSSSHGREPKAATPSSDEDCFVPHSAIKANGFKPLAEGDRVEFDIIKGPVVVKATEVDGEADRMKKIAAAIDDTYAAMRSLVTRQAGKPGLREALHPLREKLRTLQLWEAKEISEQYDARFRPAYEAAQNLIQQARQVLKKP